MCCVLWWWMFCTPNICKLQLVLIGEWERDLFPQSTQKYKPFSFFSFFFKRKKIKTSLSLTFFNGSWVASFLSTSSCSMTRRQLILPLLHHVFFLFFLNISNPNPRFPPFSVALDSSGSFSLSLFLRTKNAWSALSTSWIWFL